MAADALATWVTRWPAVFISTMYNTLDSIFHAEGLKLREPFDWYKLQIHILLFQNYT